jgi:hypothetical protein
MRVIQMSDTKQMLQRARDRFEPPEDVMGSLIRRRERKERNRRISAAVIGIAVALLGLASLTWVFRSTERPADQPTPTPKPPGIFSGVGGWIVYGPLSERCEPWPCANPKGIRAVDPTRPGVDPNNQIQLSTDRETPLAWSSDGSKLLIRRTNTERPPHQAFFGANLFVLNADGTETRLTEGNHWIGSGSLSPDGTKVVYATDPGIFVVNATGGRPQVLLTGIELYTPTFSPDGSKITYFAWDRHRYRLQVMNADGSGSRASSHDVSFEDMGGAPILVWSPDGTRLAIDYGGDIYTVRADGSDLTLVIHGGSPNWSPDGSRIAYDFEDVSYPPGPHLEIADADGKNIQEFGYARSGPWNPLVQPEVAEAPMASEGSTPASILLPVAALLTLVGGCILVRRRRRAPGA